MPDYSKGKIYTIRCLNDPNVYVGSTIQSLSVRMGAHRIDYAKNKVLGLNKEIVKNIDDWKIELHELFPCNTNQELHRREGEIIRLLGTLNKQIAGRTQREYYIDNAEKIKDQTKEYRAENVDKIKKYKREYRLLNKDVRDRKEYIKEYRLLNKDKIKEHMKEYYLKKKI